MRRRRDRVDSYNKPGATEFDVATGSVPRFSYRDLEANTAYLPDSAVYLERVQRGTGWPNRSVPRTHFPRVVSLPPSYRHPAQPDRRQSANVGTWRFQSRVPSRTWFCVRRKQRKQVLFAFKIAGRSGVGRGKRWFRNRNSHYGC